MIFAKLSISDLEKLLRPHMGQPLWPGIADPAVKARARDYARQSGLWERLAQVVCPNDPLPTLRFSEFQNYFRTGSREPHQSSLVRLSNAMDNAALALWLEHPSASVDHLQDLMWEWCGSDWSMPCHRGRHIELFGTHIGRNLSEYSAMFSSQIDQDLRDRVSSEIDRRMLDIALDWRRPDDWNTRENNWNIVCNSDLVQMALYQVSDSMQLATLIHTLCRRIDYAMDYFTPDGGCVEGPSYWEYGFGHFLNLAIALKQRTGGAVDLAHDPHVRAICRYPLSAQLRGPKRASFADSVDDYLGAQAALKVDRLVGVPELFRLVKRLPGNLLEMTDIRTLCLYNGQRPDPTPDREDYFLPSLSYAKIHAANDGSGEEVLLAVVAGTNGVSHNHNDIGSFILMFGDTVALTDPGYPVCNSKTFGPDRYDMLFCRSKGHSVPVVNGLEQPEGSEYHGTLEVSGLNETGLKTACVDLSHAYPDPTLIGLQRKIEIDPAGRMKLTDVYSFNATPKSVEEAFVTFEPVSISKEASSVRIGDGENAVAMSAQQKGTFAVEHYTPEQHEGQDQRTLHRITFHPTTLEREMKLSFVVSKAGR